MSAPPTAARTSLVAFAIAAALTLSPARSSAAVVVDRAVARFSDPEASDTAGAMRFVMMRELLMEAWMIAYERTPTGSPSVGDKEIRLALDRHVIEAVLGARTLPAATEKRVDAAVNDVRVGETVAIGGDARFADMIERATGRKDGGTTELAAIFRRRARAELYLEVGVGQAIEPSDLELRAAYAKAPEALAKQPFDDVHRALRAYVRSTRLRDAAEAYYQAVRSKLRLEIVS